MAFLWAGTAGMRPLLVAMMVLSGMIGAFEALMFSLLGRIVDTLTGLPRERLWVDGRGTLLLIVAILLASIVLVGLQTVIKHQSLAGTFPMRLRWNFHRLMLGQSLAFYQDEFAGRIAAKVMQTALAVRDFWFTLGDILVFVSVYLISLAVVVAGFNIRLLVPLLGWLLLYALAVSWFVPRLARVGKAQADARSLMTGRITDAYTNIGTVKLFSHSDREAWHAHGAMEDFIVTVHAQMRLVSAFETCNHALSMLLIMGITGTALWLWSLDLVRVGAVAAAAAMALRLNGISHWVMWEMTGLFEQIGTVQDGINTLARSRQVVDADDAQPLLVRQGEVRFEGVTFGYAREGTLRQVIDHLDLTIRPGEKIGLVGRSGAGKSTLINLLLRFYDLQGGRILIDGQDVAHVTQESLRAQIGMVTQDTSLLHRSVRDNILYGRPAASDADLHAAAEAAEALGFIRGLADARGRSGFDAHVGERGVKLSGGQRQRVALARVMLKDAPILLLDEATSALDSEVEAVIQGSLARLMEGKTVIAIAHRLSTIAAMDRLVVLDQGRIVEIGDHQTLLARGGLYARLWAHQSGGFLGADDVTTAPAAAAPRRRTADA
ncbi:MAG: ABC transporter ATP-binding protein [Pseudomonadota bacterium]|nr:ABC transporter ATP-binding protein [Pseudomonadota bacterium]